MKTIIEEIRELETKLVKLRLQTRHIDFTEDYDRDQYEKQSHIEQKEIQVLVVRYLKTLNKPITNAKLIKELVKSIPNLAERDFEKTNSGSIRVYSGIRTAIENLKKQKIISIPERGHIVLTQNS